MHNYITKSAEQNAIDSLRECATLINDIGHRGTEAIADRARLCAVSLEEKIALDAAIEELVFPVLESGGANPGGDVGGDVLHASTVPFFCPDKVLNPVQKA